MTDKTTQIDPAEADLRARILGLMEQQAVSSLLEATLEYLRNYPRSGWGWLVSVPTLIDLGRYDDAELALANARSYNSKAAKSSIYYWHCILNKERGNLKKAQRWVNKAIEADPDNGSFRVTLGDIQARRGKLKAASKTLLSAIALADSQADSGSDADLDEAHFNLALVRRSQRRYADALAETQKALVIDPSYAEAVALRHDLEAVLQGGWQGVG